MTTGATNAGVSEVARQMFDLAAVAYRAEPSDANFWALASRRPEPDDHASLSEVAYEVARTLGFKLPVIGHLANALGMEYRLSEAQHFCEAWLEQDPASKPAHRLAALIACESVDLPRARRALDKLEELGAETGTTLIVKTAMFLAFTDGSHAGITVRQSDANYVNDAHNNVIFRLENALP